MPSQTYFQGLRKYNTAQHDALLFLSSKNHKKKNAQKAFFFCCCRKYTAMAYCNFIMIKTKNLK